MSGYFKMRPITHREICERAIQDPQAFVNSCEQRYSEDLQELGEHILSHPQQCQIILLAGPSSSGKTTTARRLAQYLEKRGVGCPVVGLDDFYYGVGLGYYPKNPDGTENYEALEAIDLSLLRQCIAQLYRTGEADFPQFDFSVGRRSSKPVHLTRQKQDVLLIEGLHALNPKLLENVPISTYTISLAVEDSVVKEGSLLLSGREMRFVRRLVRDRQFRNSPLCRTLSLWPWVVEGEEKYIVPYRPMADAHLDTFLPYELCVFDPFIKRLFEGEGKSRQEKETMHWLETVFCEFPVLSPKLVPDDSILREFIGKSK